MTIREHFQRFRKHVIIGTLAVWVAAGLLWGLLDPHTSIIRGYEFGVLFALAWWAAFILFVRKRYACPRCGAGLISVRLGLFGRPNWDTRWYWEIPDKCPRCGVSFDEPWPDR